MSISRRTKVGFLITLLVVVSVGIGFAMGITLSAVIAKKKENPAFWKNAAMKHLEKLHPTDDQRKKFETHTDKAVGELATLRKDALRQVWEIVGRAVQDIDQELTPEQKETFKKIQPKHPPGDTP